MVNTGEQHEPHQHPTVNTGEQHEPINTPR
jgi:hypothetical protein